MTRRTAVITIAAMGALLCCPMGAVRAKARSYESYFSAEVLGLLDLPEPRIDVGRAALTTGKEIYPHINVAAYSMKIDRMVADARRFVHAYARDGHPESIVRALNTYYYQYFGVRYDKQSGRKKQLNCFLHHTIDTREGQCLTIPMLYMAMAQRLGYPVYGVGAPEHFFVRFVDPRLKEQNIELSAQPGHEPDAGYAWRLNISPRAIQSGAYLRTLTHREFLGVLLLQNALVFNRQGHVERAIRYLEVAEMLDPRDVYFPKNLAGLWARAATLAIKPGDAELWRSRAEHYEKKADEMGWTHDPDANTRRK